jgi:hypothetical protein
MKILSFTIFLCLFNFLNAQDYKRTAIWYFGENAGLNFNTEPPTPLTDGKVNTIEGCASMCDTNGNLLFYTDGRTVWNKNHDTVSNGFGLLGEQSQTQAALIVPFPDNDSLFYIFTTRRGSSFNAGFYYNLVNISGTGEVVEKNKLLLVPISEKLAATHHRNGRDYWVTTTDLNGNNIYTYLITNKGLITCPIISTIPKTFSESTAVGAMKFSPSGRLAAIAKLDFQVDILAFDNLTGEFNYLFPIDYPRILNRGIYSVEFSTAEKYLYVMQISGSLFQYRLQNLTETDVKSSEQIIFTNQAEIYGIQALQLGLNNKIYLSRVKSKYLGVINNPDSAYNLVDFDSAGLYLGGQNSSYGLPAMVSSFLYRPVLDFSYSLDCETNHLYLTPKNNLTGNYSWNIAKSGENPVHTANSFTAAYTFQDTGWFDVELSVTNSTDTTKVKKQLHIKPVYVLNLGNDTTLCIGQSLQLSAGSSQQCYWWQDSSTASTFVADTPGIYYVKVFSQNLCVHTDTITVSYLANPPKPVISKSNDTLYSTLANSYQWFRNGVLINGAADSIYKMSQNGFYQIRITNIYGCAKLSDSFQVKGLSIDKLKAEDYFTIYPIPAQNKLFIEPITSVTILDITLVDAIGREFHYPPSMEIDLSVLANGIYFLKITDKNNNHYITKIIIN